MRSLKTVFLVSLALILAGCLKPPRDVNHMEVARFDGTALTMDEMEQAIRRAAYLEEWQNPQRVAPGHFVVTRAADDGSWWGTVDIFYTTTDFSIHYKDSRGLRYNGLTGVIGPHYQSMVGDLADRIENVVRAIGTGRRDD